MAGYLGDHTAEEFLGRAMTDQRMECHTTIDYEDADRTHLEQIEDGTARYCAGALIFFANILKRSRDPERPRLPADREEVFAWPTEFSAHHDTPGHRAFMEEQRRMRRRGGGSDDA